MTDDSQTDTEQFLDALDPADEPPATFEAPWQARAFGLAVALRERDDHDWEEFQSRFIERIDATDEAAMQADVEGTYYERWLESLEAMLLDEAVLTEAELEQRKADFSEGERDAAEFVVDDA